MKGTKLFLEALIGFIFLWIGILFIAGKGDLKSWSIADATALAWMLRIILAGISRLNWKFADNHSKGQDVLLKQWHDIKITYKKGWIPSIKIIKSDYKLKTVFEVCGWLFMGVAIFGLGGTGFMKIAHYVFTIFAAALSFVLVIKLCKTVKERTLYTIGLIAGLTVWVLGFTGIIFTVFFGEFLFALVVVKKYFSEIKNIKE